MPGVCNPLAITTNQNKSPIGGFVNRDLIYTPRKRKYFVLKRLFCHSTSLQSKKVLGKSNEVKIKSTLVKKYFVTLQSTQKSNEVL